MSNDSKQQAVEAADALAPAPRIFVAQGKTYTVKPMRSKKLWPVLRAGLPIFDGLVALVGLKPTATDSPLGGGTTPAGQSAGGQAKGIAALLGPEIAMVIELMAEHGERVEEIIAIAIDETLAKVGEFEPQETYAAVQAVVEVNRDFFTTKVLPALGFAPGAPVPAALSAVARQVQTSIGGDGPTPSSSS